MQSRTGSLKLASPDPDRIYSGLLDTLVQHIATATESSAVFVTALAPSTGASLLAEFPASSAGPALESRCPNRALDESWADGHVIAVPIRTENASGWAAAVGPSLGRLQETEELVTLLARCAAALLDRRTDERRDGQPPRWEDAARDGYWEWDVTSGVMHFSRRSLYLLDHRQNDRPISPDVWLDRIHPDDRAGVCAALLTASDTDAPVDHEHRVVRPDGSVRRLLLRALREYDGGRPQRLSGWLCDVSRARQAEIDLRQSQSLADVGRIAASAAHDFNSFLTIIRGHTEIAVGLVEPDSSVAESLELIRHAAAGATTLTRQLLTVLRRQASVQNLVDVNDVVAGMERTLRALVGTGGELVTRLRPNAGSMRGDSAQLHRLLINLVLNARDAMPDGGVVTIETDVATVDDANLADRLGLSSPGDYVTLTVRDTGSGMDEATRARIFEPSFTTKPAGHGTGLGLWIVRDIVERFGGAIAVRSAPGQGTEFVVYFPRAPHATGR